MPRIIKFDVYLEEYDNISLLPPDSQALIERARAACNHAYAPYSGFLVGAAVLLETGEIVTGSNQENASYPCGLCAERVALFSAASRYPSVALTKLAVTAMKKGQNTYQPVAPCGACRQVISEYQANQDPPLELIMEGTNGSLMVAASIDMLLPMTFSAKHMDRTNDEI